MANTKTKSKPASNPKQEARTALLRQLPFYSAQLEYGNGMHWSISARGSYQGGCRTGKAAAFAYVKFLREASTASIDPGFELQQIIFDMFLGKRLGDARKGQIVGFLVEISKIVSMYAEEWYALDKMSFSQLAADMKSGLAFSRKAWLNGVNSENSRRGWETRRHKALGKKRAARHKTPARASTEVLRGH